MASSGAFIPRDFNFSSTSRQLCVDSRTPSSIANSRFSPRSFTPITTRAHSFAFSARRPLRDGPHQLDSKPDLLSEIFCPRILVREGAEDDPKKTT